MTTEILPVIFKIVDSIQVYISYFDINLEQCANVGHYWYGTYYVPYMEYGTYLSKSSDQSKL